MKSIKSSIGVSILKDENEILKNSDIIVQVRFIE